jgi:AcrR family transcriptional regulator
MNSKSKGDVPQLLLNRVASDLVAGNNPVISELCKELGMSPSLVQYHFENRSNLISQAWGQVVLSSIEDDFQRLDEIGSVDDWDALSGFILEVFSEQRSEVRRAHLRALSESHSDSRLQEVVDAAQEKTFQLWRSLIQKYSATGVLKPTVSIDALALMFMAVPLGITAARAKLSSTHQRELAEAWIAMLGHVLR